MRNIEEIRNTPGLVIKKEGRDGLGGTVFPIEYRKGKVKINQDIDKALHFIFSWGEEWEHLSVSTPVKTPTWEQMCKMKEIFWRDDEVCMELHPKKEEYVNNHPYCLHIWRSTGVEIPTPPSILVGIRKGKELEDVQKIKEYADRMAKW